MFEPTLFEKASQHNSQYDRIWPMLNLFDFAILAFASLFVIVDPIGLIPTFLAITPQNTVAERSRMAWIASLTAFGILILSAVGGSWVFKIFGITIPAFQIAGGAILLFIAIEMLVGKRTGTKETAEEKSEGMTKEDVAVTPLAIPLLAGPGAITAVILLAGRSATVLHGMILGGVILLVCLLAFVILKAAAIHSKFLSVTAMKIITRLMGLLLAAIAVQFVLDGIQAAKIF